MVACSPPSSPSSSSSSLVSPSKAPPLGLLPGRTVIEQDIPPPYQSGLPSTVRPPGAIPFLWSPFQMSWGIEFQDLDPDEFLNLQKRLQDADELVLKGSGLAIIIMVLVWPGYERHLLEREVTVHFSNGGHITRAQLLYEVIIFIDGLPDLIMALRPDTDNPQYHEVSGAKAGSVFMIGLCHVSEHIYRLECHIRAPWE